MPLTHPPHYGKQMPPKKDRYRTTFSVDRRLWDYLSSHIGPGRRFYNVGHAFDTLILDMMEDDREILEVGTLKAQLEELTFELKRLKADAEQRR